MLLADAWTEFSTGNYGSALTKAQLANRLSGNRNSRAWKVIGVCLCALEAQPSEVVPAYNRADADGRQMIRRVCSQHGVSLGTD